jgi:prepilin-type N-terminal cleavage/methylation domain-containing protein
MKPTFGRWKDAADLRSVEGYRMKQRRRSAFTLIELLVVITIITVLSASVAPVFLRNTDRLRLKDSVRHLQDMMSFCHSMAAFEATTFRLNLDPRENVCWISFEKDPAQEPGVFYPYRASGYAGYRLQDVVAIRDVVIREADEESMEEGEEREGDYIEFRTDGTATEAVVILANEQDERFSILVSGLTGGVRIIEEEFSEDEAKKEEERRPREKEDRRGEGPEPADQDR